MMVQAPIALVATMIGSMAWMIYDVIESTSSDWVKLVVAALLTFCGAMMVMLYRAAVQRIADLEASEAVEKRLQQESREQTARQIQAFDKKLDKQMRAFSTLLVMLWPDRVVDITRVSEEFFKGD